MEIMDFSGERGRNRTYNLLIKRDGLSSPLLLICEFSWSSGFNKMRKGRVEAGETSDLSYFDR
jgi:hypothetical protein